jgi:ATP-dependent exoDNAse (exonuclease V) beta subunit
MDDFKRAQPSNERARVQSNANGANPAKVRLLYVALTRGKHAVDVPSTMLTLLGLT